MSKTSITVGKLAELAQLHEELPLPDQVYLRNVHRVLNKWWSQLIANTIAAKDGLRVQSGPFAGMIYTADVSEGAAAPRLLGTYESELHPAILELSATADCVIDIGCAEGFYAVGMARLMPHATVYAYDVEEAARVACAENAQTNGVAERVVIGGEFRGEDFALFAKRRAMVIVDIEGGESELLDPDRFPGLRELPVIVETHPSIVEGVTEALIARFEPTHAVELVEEQVKTPPPGSWPAGAELPDKFLSVWEWRAKATPWLVMRPKAPEHQGSG